MPRPGSVCLPFAAVLATGLFSLVPAASSAATFTDLHDFAAGKKDGSTPYDPIYIGTSGILYGTTSTSGPDVKGTIFQITPAGQYATIYSFTDKEGTTAGVVQDKHGNLFGEKDTGGAHNRGELYELTNAGTFKTLYSFTSSQNGIDFTVNHVLTPLLDSKGDLFGTTFAIAYEYTSKGKFKVLHTFQCANADGCNASGPLTRDGAGNLYGVTVEGGAANQGTVYRISSTGAYSVLYSFTGGADGSMPYGALTLDPAGNLYGVTLGLKQDFVGRIFKLSPSGNLTVIHSFAPNASDPNGYYPNGGLLIDSQGNLFGTTEQGGSKQNGVAYKLSPDGTETVLYTFVQQGKPSPLTADSSGNLFGTTATGGAYGFGTVFKLTP